MDSNINARSVFDGSCKKKKNKDKKSMTQIFLLFALSCKIITIKYYPVSSSLISSFFLQKEHQNKTTNLYNEYAPHISQNTYHWDCCVCCGGLLKSKRIGSVGRHARMQGDTPGEEALLLGFVRAADVAHELGHAVLVVVGWAEGVLLHHVAWGEDDEVHGGGAGVCCLAGEDGEDGGVEVVVLDCVHRAEACKVVLEGEVVAVPAHDVKDRAVCVVLEELATVFVVDLEGDGFVLVACGGYKEVAGVGKTVCTNGAKVGEFEVPVVQLADVATAVLVVDVVDLEFDAAGDDTDLTRTDLHSAELRDNVKLAALMDKEEVAVGVLHCGIAHLGVECIEVDLDACLHGRVACACVRLQRLQPCGLL